MKPITIENAEELAQSRGIVGEIPSRRLRQSLSVGNSAWLTFAQGDLPDQVTERLLVQISRAHHDGMYTGKVISRPSRIVGLEAGALVEFWPEHVCGWEP